MRIKEGKVPNLQARGPFDNFLQFEGTGKLSVSEKKISQINILGGISNEISKLPIPFLMVH